MASAVSSHAPTTQPRRVPGYSTKQTGQKNFGHQLSFRTRLQSNPASISSNTLKPRFQVFPSSSKKSTQIWASSSETAADLESSGKDSLHQSNVDGSNSTSRTATETTSNAKVVSVDKKDKKNYSWNKVKQMAKDGSVFEGRVEATNSGGLIMFLGTLKCFLPFSQLDPSRLPSDKSAIEVAEGMIGKTISSKIIDLNESEGRIILSEKAANFEKRVSEIKEGDIHEGKVSSVTDFGIFVDIQFPDGTFPLTGLIHVSEISWDPVKDLQDAFKSGDKVKFKIIGIDISRARISLSIKQLMNDPLYETLDTILPLDYTNDNGYDNSVVGETELSIKSPLPGLENICQELMNENGVLEVAVGRMGIERKVVSQDLELWLSNAVKEEGSYTILARAGRQVQEIYVKTKLNREEMKSALRWVTSRII